MRISREWVQTHRSCFPDSSRQRSGDQEFADKAEKLIRTDRFLKIQVCLFAKAFRKAVRAPGDHHHWDFLSSSGHDQRSSIFATKAPVSDQYVQILRFHLFHAVKNIGGDHDFMSKAADP